MPELSLKFHAFNVAYLLCMRQEYSLGSRLNLVIGILIMG